MKNYRRRKRCLKYSKPGRRLSRSTPSGGIYSCHVNSAITVLPPSGCHQFFLYTRWKINQRHSVLHSICRGNEVPCWRESLFQTVSLDTSSSSGFAGYCFVLHATTLSLTNVLLSSVLSFRVDVFRRHHRWSVTACGFPDTDLTVVWLNRRTVITSNFRERSCKKLSC